MRDCEYIGSSRFLEFASAGFGSDFRGGSATAPMSGWGFGGFVLSNVSRPPFGYVFLKNTDATKTTPERLIASDKTAAANTEILSFTLAQPTGQSFVKIVPSCRW